MTLLQAIVIGIDTIASSFFGQWYQTLPQNRQQVIAIYLYLIDPNQL